MLEITLTKSLILITVKFSISLETTGFITNDTRSTLFNCFVHNLFIKSLHRNPVCIYHLNVKLSITLRHKRIEHLNQLLLNLGRFVITLRRNRIELSKEFGVGV